MDLWEMANLIPKDTGLSTVIWIGPKSGKEKHNARIKVRDKDGKKTLYPISISTKPEWVEGEPPSLSRKEINQIEEFVKLNRALLLKYWLHGDEKMSLKDVFSKLKKLNS